MNPKTGNTQAKVRFSHSDNRTADFDRSNRTHGKKEPKVDAHQRKFNKEDDKQKQPVYGRGIDTADYYVSRNETKTSKLDYSDYNYNKPTKQPIDLAYETKPYADKSSYKPKDKPEPKKDYPQKQATGYSRNTGDSDHAKVEVRDSDNRRHDKRESDYNYRSDQDYKVKNQPKDIEDDYDYRMSGKGSRNDNDDFETKDRHGKRSNYGRKDQDKAEEQNKNKNKPKNSPVVYYQRVDQSDDNSTASFHSSQHHSTASESRYDYEYSSATERSANQAGARDSKPNKKSGNQQGQDSWKASRNDRDFDRNDYEEVYKKRDHGRPAESTKNNDAGFKEHQERETKDRQPPKEDFKKKDQNPKNSRKFEEKEKPAFKPQTEQFTKKPEQKPMHNKFEEELNDHFGDEDQEYYDEYDDYEPVYEKETAYEPSNDEVVALMVAEKPSIALSVARALSDGKFTQRKGRSPICPVYQYRGSFMNHKKVLFKVTSVAGHVYSRDFPKQYADWVRTDPIDLFQAETVLIESNPKNRIVDHLKSEAKNASFLVLWLDNDREGENICFEIMGAVTSVMNKEVFKQVYRAIFSSLATPDLKESFRRISKGPNRNESISVDARQIIDLKIGVVFSRFQSLYFGEKYSKLSGNKVCLGHLDHLWALPDSCPRLLRHETHREREFQA